MPIHPITSKAMIESMRVVSAHIAKFWDEETVRTSNELYNELESIVTQAEEMGLEDIHEWEHSAEAHRMALVAWTVTALKGIEWDIPEPTDPVIIEHIHRLNVISEQIGD